MAMTKSLWSVNALSVELGRDRRTVAAALSNIPPDGTRQGHPAWYLSTALDVLDPKPPPGRRTVRDDDRIGPLWHFASRLEAWEEIRALTPKTHPIGQIAADYGVTVETVLGWLRAGLPYAQEGNWRTGEGFVLRSAWTFDWILALVCLAECPGQKAPARELRLPYL
jgi:hypothetical protein